MFKQSLSFLLNFSISSFFYFLLPSTRKKKLKEKRKVIKKSSPTWPCYIFKDRGKSEAQRTGGFFPTDIFLLSTTKEDLFSFQTRFAPLVCVCGEEKEGKKIPLNRVRAIHIWCQHLCVRVFHHPLRRPRKKKKRKVSRRTWLLVGFYIHVMWSGRRFVQHDFRRRLAYWDATREQGDFLAHPPLFLLLILFVLYFSVRKKKKKSKTFVGYKKSTTKKRPPTLLRLFLMFMIWLDFL